MNGIDVPIEMPDPSCGKQMKKLLEMFQQNLAQFKLRAPTEFNEAGRCLDGAAGRVAVGAS